MSLRLHLDPAAQLKQDKKDWRFLIIKLDADDEPAQSISKSKPWLHRDSACKHALSWSLNLEGKLEDR